jgi:signal transduction histidine kinase
MRIETVIPGVLAAAAAAIALRVWRNNVTLRARSAGLVERGEKADAENGRLRSDLSARDDRERERICRLEHDLKSPLGVILGFSMLLREYVEGRAEDLPPLPLRSINGIDQAARKMLRIIESAAEGPASDAAGEEAVVEEKNRS